jgi:aspartate/methionine/tyrosine aminotransferase
MHYLALTNAPLLQNFFYLKPIGGELSLLAALASFFNSYFYQTPPIETGHITTTAGSSNANNALLCYICNDSDLVRMLEPVWSK